MLQRVDYFHGTTARSPTMKRATSNGYIGPSQTVDKRGYTRFVLSQEVQTTDSRPSSASPRAQLDRRPLWRLRAAGGVVLRHRAAGG